MKKIFVNISQIVIAKKPAVMSLLFALISVTSFAQDEYLQLPVNCTFTTPGFNKVNIIDKRISNQTLGFVQVGALNRIARVAFRGSLTEAVSKYFLALDTSGSTQRELTILLYEIYLSERTEGLSETGRLQHSMRLFAGDNQGKYAEIANIDSVYTFNSMDVTKKLLRSVSEHLCEIAALARETPAGKQENKLLYSFADLQVLDSLEKLSLPIFNATKYNAGIFSGYTDFKNNTPDSAVITIDSSNLKDIKVYRWDAEKGKNKKIDCKTVYAVSDGNVLLKATKIGFYKLEKVDNDFYYVGQTSFSNANNVAVWGAAFGLAGAAIASGAERNSGRFRFKINYMEGNSIPIAKANE